MYSTYETPAAVQTAAAAGEAPAVIAEEMGLAEAEKAEAASPAEEHGCHVSEKLTLTEFIDEFGEGLLEQVKLQNPPVYDSARDGASAVWQERQAIMEGLKRAPFKAQAEAVQAVVKLLVDENQPAAVINAEMGTGKTMMAICAAAVMQKTHPRTLVISPPHLVYKWRREILDTVPGARVWVLNGPDTLRKLLALREALGLKTTKPEFFVLGRVRMRMGFHWQPAFVQRLRRSGEGSSRQTWRLAACPSCFAFIGKDVEGVRLPMTVEEAAGELLKHRCKCRECGSALWTLVRPGKPQEPLSVRVLKELKKLPGIGQKKAQWLIDKFGEESLADMLTDNNYALVNLMDENGEFVFNERQAARLERAMAHIEFSFGEGGYQASEFVKRYLPKKTFGLLIVDEGHEYKNEDSAQGQAMGVLTSQCAKTLLLTGTLMGGYASDLFYLLWRLNPAMMLADGFKPGRGGSLGAAAMHFMREHGVLKDVVTESESTSHRTARGKRVNLRTTKAPGFGPVGIMRYVLPITVFLKLREIGQKVLPSYDEHFIGVQMTQEQGAAYERMQRRLVAELRQALVHHDNTLLGVVMNVLLAWPDCAHRMENVMHPRSKLLLHAQAPVFADSEASPKEAEMLRICQREKAAGRRTLLYTIYSGTRDVTARLKSQLEEAGLKAAVLRASVATTRREDWVADQVERGIDVLICNPELVKTGLDLLEFPTIVFMQSGYNVYTVQQASRRSWRIGQKNPVKVYYLGYEGSTQMDCLRLLGTKIAVSQSTSGDMPDSGLDALNDADGESMEMALAKKLLQDSQPS